METINNKETGKVDRGAVIDSEDAQEAYEHLCKDDLVWVILRPISLF